MNEELKRAIEIIEQSRLTHMNWLGYLEQHPEEQYLPEHKWIGDANHHKDCVESYDLVLAELTRHRWIPVSERLPIIEKGKFLSEKVWACGKCGIDKFYYRKNGMWQSVNTGSQVSYIIYWMPIPPLQKEAKND